MNSHVPLRLATLALAGPLALAGCITAGIPVDPQSAALTRAIGTDASAFYAALAGKSEPQCRYEQNMNFYAALAASTDTLRARLAAASTGAARLRSAAALASTIEAARASHALASARGDDPHGRCMAPGAIALNAGAIARASAALTASIPFEGDR